MNANFRNFALWVIIGLVLIALFNLFQNSGQRTTGHDIAYSQFLSDVDQGRVRMVIISGQQIAGMYSDGGAFQTYAPEDPELVKRLEARGVAISAKPVTEGGQSLVGMLISWFPMFLILAVWIFFMRQMQGTGGKALGFGKSKAKLLTEAHGRVTFEDVAGVDEAKEDLQEIVEFLRDPAEVPAARRAHPARRSPGRASGHRQDAARPRHRRRGQRSVLHHLRLGLRRDVRRRRRLAASATCSSRPRRTRPASSSSMRSTRSAVTAAPASAAAMTSASRR